MLALFWKFHVTYFNEIDIYLEAVYIQHLKIIFKLYYRIWNTTGVGIGLLM